MIGLAAIGPEVTKQGIAAIILTAFQVIAVAPMGGFSRWTRSLRRSFAGSK